MKSQQDGPVTKTDLADFRRSLQADLAYLRAEIEQKIETAKEDVLRYSGILDENLRRDLFGARAEEIADLVKSRDDHEERIVQLEESTGLIAA
jgi:hypothetical protein